MRKKMAKRWMVPLVGLVLAGCQTRHAVEVAPVEVKPIHITIDVNVRIDRALDDFFGDIDEADEAVRPSTADDK